jgi:hypothetical protein
MVVAFLRTKEESRITRSHLYYVWCLLVIWKVLQERHMARTKLKEKYDPFLEYIVFILVFM